MANAPVVIRVQKLKKRFVIPHERNNSLKRVITQSLKRKTKRADVQDALNGLDFEIKQGEFFGIVGRNGSGKSTLLKILAGIYQPSEGRVQTSGKLVPFIELGVGFNPELSGRENVYLNGALLGFSHKEIEAMYDTIVSFAELERFMDQKLKNYSSGMQVRLAFSMATRAQADILLVDEVLAVGDAEFQRKCFKYFQELKRSGTTVVFVTHDMNAVREYCTRAMLIEGGKIVSEGDPSDVAKAYTQLFQPKSQSVKQEAGGKRWGTGIVKYTKLIVEPRSINQDDPLIKLSATLNVKKDCEGVVPGFAIKSASGEILAGTNTRILGQKLPKLKKGQNVTIIWSLPNIFGPGEWSVNIGALYAGMTVFADSWEGAAAFYSSRIDAGPYRATPIVSVELEVTPKGNTKK